MKKSLYQKKEDDVKLLINEAKIRNNLKDEGLAKKIGMPLNTFRKQKIHPGGMRLDYLWAIEELAGRGRGCGNDVAAG